MLTLSVVEQNDFAKTCRLRFDGIDESYYGARVEWKIDDSVTYVGIFGTSSSWSSEVLSGYEYIDASTGLREFHTFSDLLYTVEANVYSQNGNEVYGATIKFANVGHKPYFNSFTARQIAISSNDKYIRFSYSLDKDTIYIGYNYAQTNIYAYINGELVRRIEEIDDASDFFNVSVSDYGYYEVYLVVQNNIAPPDEDGYSFSTQSDTVLVKIKEKVTADDCQILYDYADEVEREYNDGKTVVTIKGYIDISKYNWERFCDAINFLRSDCNLNEIKFISGDSLSADMWNEAVSAFDDVADANYCSFDAEKFSVSKGDPITKELIDQVNADIAAVLEEITT